MVVVDAVVVFDELYIAVPLAEIVAVETLNVLVAVTVGAKPVDAGAATVALGKTGKGTTERAVSDEMTSERYADAADASSAAAELETVAAEEVIATMFWLSTPRVS